MRKETEEITLGNLQQFFGDTAAFSWSFKQDVLTFITACTKKGYTPGYALKCIAIRQAADLERFKVVSTIQEVWSERALKCPECGRTMRLDAVNQGPGDQVGGRAKSIWRCPNWKGCGFEELSNKSVQMWLKKLGVNLRKDIRPPEIENLVLPDEVLAKMEEAPAFGDL